VAQTQPLPVPMHTVQQIYRHTTEGEAVTTKEKLILLAIFLVSSVISLAIMFGFAKLIKYFWEYL
jgi:hypothetical protein